MAVYDLGDVVALGVTIYDSTGTPANATTVIATVTAPDGSASTPSVNNSGAGLYDIAYVPSMYGRHTIRWVATGTNASAYADEFTVRDFTALGVVSLDEAKAHLNITTTTDNDEELRRFMDAAEDLASSYVGVVLGRQTFVNELYDGNVDHLRLRNPKAMSITSVYENGLLLDSASYTLDPTGQRLFRITTGSLSGPNYFGVWAPGANNIKVTYVAGFQVPPPAATQGVLEILRHLWQTQRGVRNVQSRIQTGDELTSGSSYSLPRRAIELLDPLSLPGLA